MSWRLVYTAQAGRDARKLTTFGLPARTEPLLGILHENRSQAPPRFERLAGDLRGAFSRRIDIQHRLVYQVPQREGVVKVLRMWTRCE